MLQIELEQKLETLVKQRLYPAYAGGDHESDTYVYEFIGDKIDVLFSINIVQPNQSFSFRKPRLRVHEDAEGVIDTRIASEWANKIVEQLLQPGVVFKVY